MRSTSFKISKDLKELGFNASHEVSVYHVNTNDGTLRYKAPQMSNTIENGVENLKSYDFETIWEQLPIYLKLDSFTYNLELKKNDNSVYVGYGFYECNHPILLEQTPDEPLVDTIARLLIKLIKEDRIAQPLGNMTLGQSIGTIYEYSHEVDQPLLLKCEGQEVSRVTYSKLFTEIGILYGAGDRSTTFNIPNITDPIFGRLFYIKAL